MGERERCKNDGREAKGRYIVGYGGGGDESTKRNRSDLNSGEY